MIQSYQFVLGDVARSAGEHTPATDEPNVLALLAVAERLERIAELLDELVSTVGVIGR